MTASKIAIVTDSTADLPPEIIAEHNIHVIDNLVIIDGKTYIDNREISRSEFYTNMPSMLSLPTTATASAGVYQELYETLFDQGYTDVLSIHASSTLSGIINAASTAAMLFNERVHVFDSQNVSMGLGFQVIKAATMIAAGANPENILRFLTSMRNRIQLVAMLNTLEYVRRSGRVNWARARLGDLLHIKPFVKVINGQVLNLGEVRTYQKGFTRLLKFLTSFSGLENLAILHTNAEQEARQLLAQVFTHLDFEPLIVNVTTVIGSHVGPHCLGFVAVLSEPG